MCSTRQPSFEMSDLGPGLGHPGEQQVKPAERTFRQLRPARGLIHDVAETEKLVRTQAQGCAIAASLGGGRSMHLVTTRALGIVGPGRQVSRLPAGSRHRPGRSHRVSRTLRWAFRRLC